MKHNTNNSVKTVVPSIKSRCSLAETGKNEYDDYDNPLLPLRIIPHGTEPRWVTEEVEEYEGFDGNSVNIRRALKPGIYDPSCVREEPVVIITVPEDVHPIAFLKGIVADLNQAWVFVTEKVVERLRKLPTKYHQATVAYGEFFRFENLDTISLQAVKYFDDWKVFLDWEFDGKKFTRKDIPEFIILLETKE